LLLSGRLAQSAKVAAGGVQVVAGGVGVHEGEGPSGPAVGAMPIDDVPALSKIPAAGVTPRSSNRKALKIPRLIGPASPEVCSE
jgi:hypothetical protein